MATHYANDAWVNLWARRVCQSLRAKHPNAAVDQHYTCGTIEGNAETGQVITLQISVDLGEPGVPETHPTNWPLFAFLGGAVLLCVLAVLIPAVLVI